MERIFYNTKLKKIIIAILIVILVLNFVMPSTINFVFAFEYEESLFYPDDPNGWTRCAPEDLQNANDTDWKFSDWDFDSERQKNFLMANVQNYNPDLPTQMNEDVNAKIASANLAFEEYNKSLGQSYNYNNDPANTSNKITLGQALRDAIDAAVKAGNELEEKYTVEPSETANLGGILLSPIFYLINFVADAVINAVGSVMMPEESFDLGIGVLSTSKPTHNYEKTYSISVDTSTFIPDLGNIISSTIGGGENTISYQYPNLPYTPEAIFSGEVELLSIDFITGKTSTGEEVKNEGWVNIRKVISQWYQVLRMIAIIGLLSVLIYTGIKIILSANAKDKAKYKEWIIDWLMAVAILFAMHIIMAFIISVTGEFSKLMTKAFQGIEVIPTAGGNGSFVTNLMGLVRFMVQSENFYIKIGYEVMYIALIFYTIKFTFTYLKRVLNMAFLTLIAPIVALTYPIDKINDGRAQGFDMWLKEYIFNALLQPMHAILYYVLVGSAVGIAANNPIYGIVVLAFMTEAEKLLKKIFGFDKAGGGTVGGMTTAFAAGAIASNIAKMAKLGKGGSGKGGSGGDDSVDALYNNPKGIADKSKDDGLFDSQEEDFDEDDILKNTTLTDGHDASENNQAKPLINRNENILDEDDILANTTLAEEKNRLNSNANEDIAKNADKEDVKKKEQNKYVRGAKAVGKRLVKPVWDSEQDVKYNGKRLLKKAGRAYLGASLGIGAAAVQAGISITDGKYNPAEGVAAMAAGYAGGGKIASGVGSLWNTFQEGTLPEEEKARRQKIMERAQKKFPEREDVIKYNQKYNSEERGKIVDIQKQLLAQGVTDLKEMDSCIKYIKKQNNNSLDGYTPEMVQKSRVVTDFFNKDLKSVGMQKAVRDLGERDKYIKSATQHLSGPEKDRQVRILNNKFNETAKFLDAQK